MKLTNLHLHNFSYMVIRLSLLLHASFIDAHALDIPKFDSNTDLISKIEKQLCQYAAAQ